MAVRQLFELGGRTALVTGGSRGLGLQIAEALGEMGARIVVSSRKRADLDHAVDHLRSMNIEASSVAFDLSKGDDVSALVSDTLDRLGHIDILVNNAGATWGSAAEDYPLEAWDKVMNINVRAIFLLCQSIGRQSMIPRRYGRIVNIASIAGLRGNPPRTMSTIAYNTSKAAIINFTRALATEWGRYGITVNAIAPGWFLTKMSRGVLDEFGERTLAQHAPLQRLGDNEDLKGAAILFASEASRHITGQVLPVDGGVSAVMDWGEPLPSRGLEKL